MAFFSCWKDRRHTPPEVLERKEKEKEKEKKKKKKKKKKRKKEKEKKRKEGRMVSERNGFGNDNLTVSRPVPRVRAHDRSRVHVEVVSCSSLP